MLDLQVLQHMKIFYQILKLRISVFNEIFQDIAKFFFFKCHIKLKQSFIHLLISSEQGSILEVKV